MPKYVVVHPLGKEVNAEAATPSAKAVKAQATKDAYWVRSWYLRDEGKLYCEWDAKDANSVRQAIDRANATLPQQARFPVAGVYELEMAVSSEDFR